MLPMLIAGRLRLNMSVLGSEREFLTITFTMRQDLSLKLHRLFLVLRLVPADFQEPGPNVQRDDIRQRFRALRPSPRQRAGAKVPRQQDDGNCFTRSRPVSGETSHEPRRSQQSGSVPYYRPSFSCRGCGGVKAFH